MPRLSKGSILGYASDSGSWGSYTAPAAWLPPLSFTPIESRPSADVPTMGRRGAAGLFVEEHTREQIIFAGRVEHHMHYQAGGMHFLLLHGLGAVASAGSNPTVHTYTLGDAPTLGLSVTINRGEAVSETAAGGRVTGFEIRHANGTDGDGLMMVGLDAIWKKSGAGEESLVVPTYTPITRKALASQMTGFTWNSADRKAFLLDYTITGDRQTRRAPAFGDKSTQEPIQTGPHMVTLSARFRREDGSLYAGLRAGTQGDLVIAYSGTNTDALTITLRNAIVESVVPEHSASTNEVIETVTFKVFGDASDSPLTIAVSNEASDPATN